MNKIPTRFLLFGNVAYDDLPQREHAFAEELARRGFFVRFVNPMPSLASITKSLMNNQHVLRPTFAGYKEDIAGYAGFEVVTPPLVPTFFRSSWTPAIDRRIFKHWFQSEFREWPWNDTVVLVMFPYWRAGFVNRAMCPARVLLYDVCDALEMPSRNRYALKQMQRGYRLLSQEVDGVTYSARTMSSWLEKDFGAKMVVCIENAVGEGFAGPDTSNTANREKVIGYVGGGDLRWLDLDLVCAVAEEFPANPVVIRADLERKCADKLTSYRNVRLIGRKSRSEVAELMSTFAVGLIPFKYNVVTRVVNPLKLYEYAMVGVPVVATSTEELRHYRDLIHLADGTEDFCRCVREVLRRENDKERDRLKEFARGNTWNHRVDLLLERIEAMWMTKNRSEA